MVEGHQVHRVAHAHRRLLLGHSFHCHSPNARFTAGAAAIHGKVLSRIEAVGKNLFYFFGPSKLPAQATECVHTHFGMSGAFKVLSLPGPEPRATTRLAMTSQSQGLVAHLSAMTVAHGPPSLYDEKAAKLGPDPLREDADAELLWAKLQRCKKPIGLVLMSQDLVAGVGNIFRAEILFKAGVHPEQPASTIDRPTFDRIWHHSVALLQRGFVTGSILTVDPDEAAVLGQPWTRRYIYNQQACGRCKSAVQTWDMAGRKVYCCPKCQPLRLPGKTATTAAAVAAAATTTAAATAATAAAVVATQQNVGSGPASPAPAAKRSRRTARGGSAAPKASAPSSADRQGDEEPEAAEPTALLSPARQAALRAAAAAQPFRSHCAPDPASSLPPARMTVAELKAKLSLLGLGVKGNKAQLVARLQAASQPQATEAATEGAGQGAPSVLVGDSNSGGEEGDGDEQGGDGVDLAEALLRGRLTPNLPGANTSVQGPRANGDKGLSATNGDGAAAGDQKAARGAGEGSMSAAAAGPSTPAATHGSTAKRTRRTGKAAADVASMAVVPGTAALADAMVSAKDAALEKARAHEGRNVEHVALEDDDTAALLSTQQPSKRRRRG